MNGARQNELDRMSVKRLVNYLEKTVLYSGPRRLRRICEMESASTLIMLVLVNRVLVYEANLKVGNHQDDHDK